MPILFQASMFGIERAHGATPGWGAGSPEGPRDCVHLLGCSKSKLLSIPIEEIAGKPWAILKK